MTATSNRPKDAAAPGASGTGPLRCVTVDLRTPSGQDLVRRLVRGRVDLTPLVTHPFSLDDIAQAFQTPASEADGSIKVEVTP